MKFGGALLNIVLIEKMIKCIMLIVLQAVIRPYVELLVKVSGSTDWCKLIILKLSFMMVLNSSFELIWFYAN